jgi:hypothetical protein
VPWRIQLLHHLRILLLEPEALDLVRHVEQFGNRLVLDERLVRLWLVGRRRRPLGEVGRLIGVDLADPGPEPGAVDLRARGTRTRRRAIVSQSPTSTRESRQGTYSDWSAALALLLYASWLDHQPVVHEPNIDPPLPAQLNEPDIPLKLVDLIREV